MAFLYPDVLPLDVKVDSRRNAERIIYNAAKQLDSSFHVFYSRAWRLPLSWTKRQGGNAIGECDFIFLSEAYGLLCVECKGGAISHAQSGFYSTDKRGKIHPIKDPYGQALRSKYHFLRFFRSIGLSEFLSPRGDEYIRHSVFFPESLDTGWMKEDVSFSKEITGFALNIKFLASWLHQVFGGTLFERELFPLNPSTISKLSAVISPVTSCRFTLAPIVRDTEEYFDQKLIPTSEQWHLIDQLRFRKKELIIGAAGTGKTLVVLEYLKRNAEVKSKTLFLCASSFLAHDVRRVHSQLLNAFHVKSLSEFIDDILATCEEYEIAYHGLSLVQMLEILATKTSFRFSILVIDEMQDICPPLRLALSRLVKSNGQFICCYDPEQDPFDSNYPIQTAAEMGFDSVDTLTYNIRNTPEIMEYFLSSCPSKTVWRSLAPSGAPIKQIVKTGQGYSNLIEIVYSVIEQLDVSPSMIAVLFSGYDCLVAAKAIVTNSMANGLVGLGWVSLRLSTVIDFKGLESSVVLVWDSKSLSETELYIACSRARSSLFLVNS